MADTRPRNRYAHMKEIEKEMEPERPPYVIENVTHCEGEVWPREAKFGRKKIGRCSIARKFFAQKIKEKGVV